MTKKDLEQFIYKVEQLQEMVQSLENFSERRYLLENCKTHEEVVILAKSWGFDIGKRWGE